MGKAYELEGKNQKKNFDWIMILFLIYFLRLIQLKIPIRRNTRMICGSLQYCPLWIGCGWIRRPMNRKLSLFVQVYGDRDQPTTFLFYHHYQ
jgi:hypothetical protein